MTPQIFLASRSPRRRELLRQIGVSHIPVDVDVDESIRYREAPADYVMRLALAKARAGAAQRPSGNRLPVLAADTAVVAGAEILGKPGDPEQALKMLRTLSGRSHQVLTAVALVAQLAESRLCSSRVSFRRISDAEIAAYWHSGEPADKAGSYAIQGLAAVFIERLEGSYSGVMGLPLYETAELLANAGIKLLLDRQITEEQMDE